MARMGKLKLTAALVVVTLIVVVFLQNSEPVRFKFLFFDSIEIPKTFIILGSAVFGALVTLLIQFVWRRRKRSSAPQSASTVPSA